MAVVGKALGLAFQQALQLRPDDAENRNACQGPPENSGESAFQGLFLGGES